MNSDDLSKLYINKRLSFISAAMRFRNLFRIERLNHRIINIERGFRKDITFEDTFVHLCVGKKRDQ